MGVVMIKVSFTMINNEPKKNNTSKKYHLTGKGNVTRTNEQ